MKIISLLLVILVCVSLCGCKKNAEDLSSLPTSANSISSGVESKVSSIQSDISDVGSEQSVVSEVSSVNTVVSESSVSNVSSKTTTTVETPKVCTHNFNTITVDAKCTTDGYALKTCTLCGITEKTVIGATGHNMSSGKCTACGYADVDECRKAVGNWLQTNHNGKYVLSDSRYYLKTAGGGNLFFYFVDGNNESIIVSVYGWEKNLCYIEYIKNSNIEGEFPMDSVHSTNRIYFNQMNGTAWGDEKTQMITELRSKIDGVLLSLQDVMLNNIGISLKDIGFTAY